MMRKTLLVGLWLLCVQLLYAQQPELQCEVTLNVERLQSEARVRLANFAQTVRNYMNNYRWTNSTEFETDEDRIKCQIQFVFMDANLGASPPVYSAQVFIGVTRPIYRASMTASTLRMLDGALEFAYNEQQGVLLHNELVHNPLASFLDFYANVIIGYDFDTYRKLGGTPYFEKALRIKRLAQEQSPFPRGWQFGDNGGNNRAAMIDEILDARFLKMREVLYDYHYNGLDEFYRDPNAARETILNCIKTIAEVDARFPRSLFVRRFFESKAIEITEVFRSAPQKMREELLEILRKVDPSRLQQTYEPNLAGNRP
ncbi:MAG: DUF4835 family protein [Chloroherpetonaceae bacterium]|nr:DUF4835 family protein [Chloroherpetonaceae bacterium]MCS7211324.1 DUF4835 family protein [Chloroherpetonaceae bacterium]MDW8020279.1 DUF4835 family protein [Chloroherpetonaceae bacterium]